MRPMYNETFVLVSTEGLNQPECSPCITKEKIVVKYHGTNVNLTTSLKSAPVACSAGGSRRSSWASAATWRLRCCRCRRRSWWRRWGSTPRDTPRDPEWAERFAYSIMYVLCRAKLCLKSCENLEATEFPIPSCWEVFQIFFREFPGMWAATAEGYCPSRAGELPKNNPKNLSAWWVGKLCTDFVAYELPPNPLCFLNDKVSIFGCSGPE